jgi:excisionase family DNA binding protein
VLTNRSAAEVEVQLRRVRAHIEELRRVGRGEDAEAVGFVRDLAEQALAARRPKQQHALLTTGEAAVALGISDQTVRNWVAAGRLPAVKRGVRTMIPREAVSEEIERSRVQPPEEPAPTAEDEAGLAWRREQLAALPRDVVDRLDELHDKLEDGQELSAEELAELVGLERAMTDAAARHLKERIHRGRAGAV